MIVLKPEHIAAGLALEDNGTYLELKRDGEPLGGFAYHASSERILYEADQVIKREGLCHK